MTYVITQKCIDVADGACTKVCPSDCIYQGSRARYIHPDECIDCGACEAVCPVQAIYYQEDVPGESEVFIADNAEFFRKTLDGISAPLGSPRGAKKIGALGKDTALVEQYPGKG